MFSKNKGFKRASIVSVIIVAALSFFMPQTAFATADGSPPSGSGGANAYTTCKWRCYSGSPAIDHQGIMWQSLPNGGVTSAMTNEHWPYDGHTWTKGAYLSVAGPSAPRTWLRFKAGQVCQGGCSSSDYSVNSLTASNGQLNDGDLVNEASNNGYHWVGNKYWYNNGSRSLDIVDLGVKKIPRSDTRKTIIRVTTSKDGVTFNRTGDTPVNLYNNPTKSSSYAHKTTVGETSTHSNTVTVEYWNVTKKWTDVCNQANQCTQQGVAYSASGAGSKSRTINATFTKPDIIQQKYRPLFLNRNGVATSADTNVNGFGGYLDSSLPAIDGTTDNLRGVTNGSSLPLLDTNTPFRFKFQLNNSNFGLSKGSVDINKPSDVTVFTNGGFDMGGNSAKGTLTSSGTNITWNAASSGNFVFNPAIKAGSQYMSKNTTLSLGEGQTNGFNERDGTSTPIIIKKNSASSEAVPFNGIFTLRNIFSQKNIQLSNGVAAGTDSNGNSIGQAWTVDYNQGRYWKYGVSYAGTIDLNGVDAPSSTGNQFYTQMNIQQFSQPVFNAIFDSATVGGYSN